MNGNDAVLAVVLPSYGHPSLMIDAVESALCQQTSISYRIVLVNDGCPLQQTEQVCRAYARAHPDRILYVHKANGGLSSARNRGVAVALQTWPDIDAFYFLDADNRLSPRLLEKSYAHLLAHPEVDWVFSDVLMFGSENAYHDSAGPFTRLQFLMQNYCEAASLVRRRVFDTGVAYDESMRLGYEDWEFWLQCIQKGLQGVHGHAVGFLYRKRPESMLANSSRDHDQIISYLRRKHQSLFNLRQANAIAAKEFPRFAIYVPETGGMTLTSDFEFVESQSWPEFARRLRRWRDSRRAEHCPATVLFASGEVLKLLRERGLAANVLWLLEADLEQNSVSILNLRQHFGVARRSHLTEAKSAELAENRDAHLCAIRRDALDRCLRGKGADLWESLAPLPNTTGVCERTLDIECYGRPRDLDTTAFAELRELVRQNREAYRRGPKITMIPPRHSLRPPFDPHPIFQHVFQTPPPPPMVLPAASRNMAFVVPTDADTAVVQLARLIQRDGWHAHLFVIGAEHAPLGREFETIFDSIHLVPDAHLLTPARLVGFFGMMDAVVNWQCAAFHAAAGDLRRLGLKLMTYVQSVGNQADAVNGHSTVQYEHALHRLLVASRRAENWLMTFGVPQEKIIYLPNGPGLDVPRVRVEASLVERAQRTADQPLRVLCELRRGHSDDLDHLAALVREGDRRGLKLDWGCLADRPENLPDAANAAWQVLDRHIQPLCQTAQARIRQYAWADVVLELSGIESSPLTALDAQQLGCVPIVTDAGAVDEIVHNDETGFLLPIEESASRLTELTLAKLQHLQQNRPKLMQMARQAAARASASSWQNNARDWLACLSAWFPVQGE